MIIDEYDTLENLNEKNAFSIHNTGFKKDNKPKNVEFSTDTERSRIETTAIEAPLVGIFFS